MTRTLFTATLLALSPSLVLTGCGDDGAEITNQRGVPQVQSSGSKAGAGKPGAGKPGGSRRSTGNKGAAASEAEQEPELERPDRPRPVLTRDDFSGRARDPFHNYAAAEVLDDPAPVEIVRKQREVKLAEYTFDELRLIAIVNAGRSVAPRALFVAGDNKSKSVRQGEYFSSAEVLLASVNRDYIEIEVVDPELTPGWNLQRGERKVIYLKEK